MKLMRKSATVFLDTPIDCAYCATSVVLQARGPRAPISVRRGTSADRIAVRVIHGINSMFKSSPDVVRRRTIEYDRDMQAACVTLWQDHGPTLVNDRRPRCPQRSTAIAGFERPRQRGRVACRRSRYCCASNDRRIYRSANVHVHGNTHLDLHTSPARPCRGSTPNRRRLRELAPTAAWQRRCMHRALGRRSADLQRLGARSDRCGRRRGT